MNRRPGFVALSCLSVLLLLCGGVGFVGFALLRGTATDVASAQSARRIVYGLTLLPSGFDPHINASVELTIPLRSIYDTLLYRDPSTDEFVPGLAERLEISADGLRYTFFLRKDVTFHDGEPFNTAAVAATLDRITNPETKSQKALFMLGSYTGYEIIDPFTITLILSQPYAAFLDALSQSYLGIASPKALLEYDRDRYQLHQVGTGPYMMVTFVPGDYILLRRNPNYHWGPPFYLTANPAPIEEVEFRFFVDPATRAPALETGAAEVMGELAPLDAVDIARTEGLALVPQPIPGMPFQFFMNTTRPPLDNVALRRALIQATNRIAITDSIFQQFSPPAYGALSATTPFYDKNAKDYYPYDREAARKAIRALGYADSDNDGILEMNGVKLSLIMVVPSWGNAPQIAQKIQSAWREIGIELELRQVPGLAALREAQRTNEYHLLAFNDYGVDANLLTLFYRSDAPNNLSKFANAELDGWLSRAAQSLDPADRAGLYTAAQRLIMDQALILPIRDTVNLNGVSGRVGNLIFDAYGWSPLLWNATLGD
ncbi:MAG TPA: ABC transporter substrate-binding protein [Aggregatilineales bacterium]|nr:hypothetical protein [Anaerolineales bacterium]HRE48294.1 ABC transporter substrate-binding protein [Aggregatilineales bacterium]